MDPATRLKLMGALTTVVFPLVAVLVPVLVARRIGPPERDRRGVVGLAALLGVWVAWLGINGWPGLPPAEAAKWVPWLALVAGGLGLGLDRARLSGVPAAVAITALAALTLGFGAWRIQAPLAPQALVLEPLALGVLAWLVLERATQARTATPIVLGPLAVALGTGAVVMALSGSARFGQTLGAMAVVFGVLSLAGWRWPDLLAGRGAVAVAVPTLVLMLLVGHFYVDVPRSVVALVLVSTLVPALFVGRSSWRAVVVAAALTAIPAGAALYVVQLEPVEAPVTGDAPAQDAPADEDGTYYPY